MTTYYTVTTWHNGDGERGERTEHDVHVGPTPDNTSREELHLRLLEALNVNLASLAESAERMARRMDDMCQMQAGF